MKTMSRYTEEMPDNATDQPLVTFALFAYNQEEFIREAVEGAFAQTYEPLEIILSDDCSSDHTYEILQELAAAYEGPHKTVVMQSKQNRGTLGHILDVVNSSYGEFFIVAAGDDISLPERTEKLVSILKDSEADIISSTSDVIDKNGHSIHERFEHKFQEYGTTFGFKVKRIEGATAGYKRSFLSELPNPQNSILVDDAAFEIISHFMHKSVIHTNTSMVKYRHHNQNVSVRNVSDLRQYELNYAKNRKEYAKAAIFALGVLREERGLNDEVKNLEKYSSFLLKASNWRNMNFIDKISMITYAPNRSLLNWYLPRAIIPWSLFIPLRRIYIKLRK